MYIKRKIKINLEEEYLEFGVPVIKLKSGQEEMCFLIDTGCTQSIIGTKTLDKQIEFKEFNSDNNKLELIGLGKTDVVNKTGFLTFAIDNINIKHLFLIFDIDNINQTDSNLKFDAILGSDFFKKYQNIISFTENQLVFVKYISVKRLCLKIVSKILGFVVSKRGNKD